MRTRVITNNGKSICYFVYMDMEITITWCNGKWKFVNYQDFHLMECDSRSVYSSL